MSRGRRGLAHAQQRIETWTKAGVRAFDRFRATRLYVQIWSTALLLALAALVVRVDWEPLQPARQAIAWAVLEDYDFAGQARRVQRWSEEHGGWLGAGEHIAQRGQALLGRWIDFFRASGPSEYPHVRGRPH